MHALQNCLIQLSFYLKCSHMNDRWRVTALRFPLSNGVHATYTQLPDQYQIVLRGCGLLKMTHSDAHLGTA